MDHRRATAERNAEAILDAAERLLRRRAQASIAAVAAESGLSRVTVYSHFATRDDLLQAVVERTVRGATAALEAAEPDRGPPLEALRRVIGAGWREIERHDAIAAASGAQLSASARRRGHEESLDPLVRRLVERGRRAGAFRTDVPVSWMVAVFYALVHAAADEAHAGRIDPDAALAALQTTMEDAYRA